MIPQRFLWWCGLGLAAAGLAALASLPTAEANLPASYLNGIDVSHYQGTVNWNSVAQAGYTFAFAKATEGTTYKDPTFPTNWANMKSAGLVRGAYHYGHPGSSAVTQANFFVNYVKPTHGDLQLVLDLETTDGETPAQVWQWTQAFIKQVQTLTGRPGIIYTGYSFWVNSVGNPKNNLNCPLWVAAYGVSKPQVPPAWSTWSFWQYSDTGSVSGVSGACDLDYFNGSKTQLLALTLP
jgi:lysozyme